MTAWIDLSGCDRLIERVKTIQNPDATLLMKRLMHVMEEDNRKGILAGLDKDGKPMTKVTYRPKPSARKLTKAQKNNAAGRYGVFAGIGDHAAGINNNLTAAEYRRLAGAPLAPRGLFSRVITNFATSYEKVSSHVWFVIGLWKDVVNTEGKTFLHYHFGDDDEPERGRLPRRDLRGVRPAGMEKARKSSVAWLADQVRWVAKGGAKPAA